MNIFTAWELNKFNKYQHDNMTKADRSKFASTVRYIFYNVN